MRRPGSRLTAAVLACALAPVSGALTAQQQSARKPLSSGIQAAGAQVDSSTPGPIVLLANRTDSQATDGVRVALTSPDPLVRQAAARVASVAHPEALDALLRALPNETDSAVAAEFIRDALALGGVGALPSVEPVVQRVGAIGVIPLAQWFARMQPEEFLVRLPEWSKATGASDHLASVVALAITRHPELRERILAAWKPLASETSWKRTMDTIDHVVTMRTPPGLAADVLPPTLSAAGCTARSQTIASALVTYAASARPVRIDVNVAGLSEECRNVLSAIARVSLDADNSGGKPQMLVVPMTPGFVSCVTRAEPGFEPRSIPKGAREPRLKKEVKPSYTRAATAGKVQGVEELDAIISSTGCVRSAEVTKNLDPGLDAQGIVAVIQWRFDPATLESQPVPVLVSVELTFTLR